MVALGFIAYPGLFERFKSLPRVENLGISHISVPEIWQSGNSLRIDLCFRAVTAYVLNHNRSGKFETLQKRFFVHVSALIGTMEKFSKKESTTLDSFILQMPASPDVKVLNSFVKYASDFNISEEESSIN